MTHADPAFAAKAAKAPSQEDVPPDHVADPTAVPRMGTHWVDGRSRTWQGMRFGSTVAYGFYDGRMVFIEPLVTRAYLRSIAADGIRLRPPARYPGTGAYPSRVRVAYDEGTHLYRVDLTDFVVHESGDAHALRRSWNRRTPSRS
jgi:hypothetical protein